jgi:uncharacterized damage-inducible protein DinB
MPSMMEPMIAELDQEAVATLRMLECVPEDKLDWAPHVKSMTLGQLALHVASLVGGISGLLQLDSFDASDIGSTTAHPESKAQILQAFADSQPAAKERLAALSEEQALAPWTLTNHGSEVFTVPKIGLARSLMFNHLYHHRGQLSVYLRLLNVSVPVTYGRTADESSF